MRKNKIKRGFSGVNLCIQINLLIKAKNISIFLKS